MGRVSLGAIAELELYEMSRRHSRKIRCLDSERRNVKHNREELIRSRFEENINFILRKWYP